MQWGLLLNFAEACPKITKYLQALGRDRAADLMRLTGLEERLSQQHSDGTRTLSKILQTRYHCGACKTAAFEQALKGNGPTR
jgi:hypothetical protein